MSPPLLYIVRVLLLAGIYFVAGALSLQLAIPPGFAVPVWPAAGIALAAILIFGYRLLPGVFLGAFSVNLLIAAGNLSDILGTSLSSVLMTAGIGCGATLQAGISAFALRRLIAFPSALTTTRQVMLLFMVGGVAGCAINGFIGPLSLYAADVIPADSFAVSVYTWWAGDAIGVMLLTPVLLLLANRSVLVVRKLIVMVPLLMLGTFTIIAFVATGATQQERARQQFEAEMRKVAVELDKSVDAHVGALRSVASFMTVRPEVTQREFDRFIGEIRRRHPALHVVTWNPRVEGRQREQFEAQMRAAGFQDFTILHRQPDDSTTVASQRDVYFPTVLISPPMVAGQIRGKDALSPDGRRHFRESVLARARDLGAVLVDERVPLRHAQDRYGFVVYAPVYGDMSDESAASRREALRGYVLGVFRLAAFMAPVARAAASQQAEFVVYDIDAPPQEQFLFDSRHGESGSLLEPIPAADSVLHSQMTVAIAGNRWVVTFFEKSLSAALQRGWYTWYVLLGGLLLSGLVGGMLLLISAGFAPSLTAPAGVVGAAGTGTTENLSDSSALFVLSIGIASISLGLLVVFGWHAGLSAVVQILPTFAPMQYNTALGFVLCGTALLALHWHRSAFAVLSAGLLALVGTLTLFEYGTGVNLGIDELFMDHYITARSAQPGRMAPSTAVAFAVIGAGVLASVAARDAGRGQRLLSGAGWISIMLGALALLSYAGGFAKIYDLFQVTEMAANTAMGFVAVGAGLLAHNGWLRTPSGTNLQAIWIAVVAILIMSLLSLGLWQELLQHQRQILASEFFSQHTTRPEMELIRASNLPTLVLVGGLMIALLLGIAIFYASAAAQNSRTLYRQSQALMRSTGRLAAVLDTAPDGIISLDEHGRIAQLNEAVCEMFGYSQEALLGREIHLLVPDALRAKHFDYVAEYVRKGSHRDMAVGREVLGRRRDGSDFPVEVRLGKSPQPDGSVQVVATVRDVADRKAAEAEREMFIDRLSASNEELQRFAYVCSHDLQEPLRTIRSFTERLAQHLQHTFAEDERAKTYFDFVAASATRAQDLINDILAYSRVEQGARKFEPVDTTKIVATIVEGMTLELERSGGRIEVSQLPVVIGNKVQLYQLFQNLINNAMKYRDPGRDPRIAVDCRERGEYWEFSISDNGIGIAAHQLEKIFEIFQRLHTTAEYPGTGVGLAISKKVVEHHGGDIWATSEAGVGTTMHFTLARNAQETAG